MIAALLLIQAMDPEPSYQAAETTIAQIRANPERYADKLLRVRGWINRCVPMSCTIDERRSPNMADRGASLSIRESEIFDDFIRGHIPARVVIDVAFSNTCLKNEVCTDRPPQLGIVRAALDPNGDEIPTRD